MPRFFLRALACWWGLLAVAPACSPGALEGESLLVNDPDGASLPLDGPLRRADVLPRGSDLARLDGAVLADLRPDTVADEGLRPPAWAQVAAPQLYVAAKNASAAFKAKAHYQCDGVSDQVEIQKAIDSLGGTLGEVVLSDGTFQIGSNTFLRSHTILSGQGADQTVLHMDLGGWGLYPQADYALIRRLKITGGGSIYITRSHVAVWDVTSTIDNTKPGAFYVYAVTDLTDIEFVNCQAINCGTFGFINHSPRDNPKYIRNLRYINCQAINCGLKSRFNQWVTGFCFAESNNLEHVRVENCRAEGNWESGFHQEDTPTIKDFVYKNCSASDNGRATGGTFAGKSYTGPYFGYGFIAQDDTVLEHCESTGNYRGIWISQNSEARETVNKGSSSWGFWCRNTSVGNKLVNSFDEGSHPSYQGKCVLLKN